MLTTSAEPIVVTVSHRLGRAEARRRIDNGLGSIRAEVAPLVKSLDYGWHGDRLDFRASVMFQTISGGIEVHEDHVRIEFNLPRLLHMAAKRLVGRIQQQGAALLEDKSGDRR